MRREGHRAAPRGGRQLGAIASLLALACPRHAWAAEDSRLLGEEGLSLLQSGLAVRAQSGGGAAASAAAIRRARAELAKDLRHGQYGGPELLKNFAHCHAEGNGSACGFASLTEDTLIYPGNGTGCLNGPYAFLVSPGDRDKLLLFFQGGGCCWNEIAYLEMACTVSVEDSLGESNASFRSGVFNRSDNRNPFRSYTMIRALYCTGDSHSSDTPVLWDPKKLNTSTRTLGRPNVLSVLSWVRTHMAGTLESFVGAGGSAGGLALQSWSWYLLNSLKWRRAAILPDSYGGLSPYNAGVSFGGEGCPSMMMSPKGAAKCAAEGQLHWHDALKTAVDDFPEARFGYVISKGDSVQRKYYMWQGLSLFRPLQEVNFTASGLNFRLMKLLGELIGKPNFRIYLLNGELHQFLDRPRLFEESSCGSDAATLQAGQPKLAEWLREVVTDTPALPKDVCCGPRMPDSPLNPAEYCSSAEFPERS